MAAINQRLGLFWTSNSGQARGDIGQVGGSFLNLGRNMGQSGRQAGLVNQQMRALGTTLKYMFAGGVIYGSMNMVRNLAQFQQQLGLISAIGSSAGFGLTGKSLDNLRNQMYGASTELITPLSDVADAVTNYLSTVQQGKGVSNNDIIPSIVEIGKAAKLSQTPVEDMTKALTTMNVAFGRTPTTRNISDLAAKWYELISKAPGGVSAAPQLAGQMGTLAAGARLANVTPGQMMALTLGTLRFGIPPSQAGQGLAYLLRSVATPDAPGTVKSARALFGQLGITNDTVQSQGGLSALFKVFAAAKGAGVRGNFTAARQKAIASQNDPNFDPNNISDLGLSGAGVNVIATVFRRQHALRTAIALYTMWNSGQLQKDLKTLGDSTNAFAGQQHDFAQAWSRFSAQSGLSKAATALGNIQAQAAQSFLPILNPIAGGITGGASFLQKHATLTKGLTLGTAGLIAALGLNKVTGGRVFGHIPGVNRLFGMAGQSALSVKAAEDAVKGITNQQPGMSPEHPLYVIVVGQLMKSPGTTTAAGGTEQKVEQKVVDEGKKWAPWIGSALQKAGGWRMLGRAGVGAAIGYGLGRFQNAFLNDSGNQSGVLNIGGLHFMPSGKKGMGGMWFKAGGGNLSSDTMIGGKDRTAMQIEVAKRLHTTFQNVQKLERNLNSPGLAKVLKDSNDKLIGSIVQGAAGFTLDLTIEQGGKAVATKRVHLPPDTFSGGKTPGARGGKKVMKVTPHQRNT